MVYNVEKRVYTIEKRVYNAEKRVCTIEKRVYNVEKRVYTIEKRVYNVEKRVYTIDKRVYNVEKLGMSLLLTKSSFEVSMKVPMIQNLTLVFSSLCYTDIL